MTLINAMNATWTLTRSRVGAPRPSAAFDELLTDARTEPTAASTLIRTGRTREQIDRMLGQGVISREEVGLFSLLMLQAENGHEASGAFLSSLRMKTTLAAWQVQQRAVNAPGDDAAALISWWMMAHEVDASGFVSLGSEELWAFPHPKASPTLKEAWREITARLSHQTKQFRVAMFLSRLYQANVGEARLLRSGESGFRNPFGDGLFTLNDMISAMMLDLDRISSTDLETDRLDQRGFLEELQGALRRRGVGLGAGAGRPLF